MKRLFRLIFILICLFLSACSPSARSKMSFDEIRKVVSGKTEAEVKELLGSPDRCESLLFGDERCTWWNYTYLGKEWAPEVRGRIVHLEITFAGPLIPAAGQEERSRWRVSEPYGVGFAVPGDLDGKTPPLNKSARGRV